MNQKIPTQLNLFNQTVQEKVQTVQEWKAEQYIRNKGLKIRLNGDVFQNGKKLSKFLASYHRKKIREILNTKY